MVRKPHVPMSPGDRPQQRINLVAELPPRPAVPIQVGYDVFPEESMRKRPWPRLPSLLVGTEWAQTPMHSGVNAYYLEARRHYWMLWNRWLDENDWTPKWCWQAAGFCARKGVDRHAAAVYLLMDYFELDGTLARLKHDSWINETGELSVEEVRAITATIRAKPRPRPE